MRYVIENEDLMIIGQERSIPTRELTPYKLAKLNCNLSLAKQHSGPLFSGPLELSIEFYFPYTKNSPRGFYIGRPNLATMTKFIIEAGLGAIIRDDATIVALNCKKIYDCKSRVELNINTV